MGDDDREQMSDQPSELASCMQGCQILLLGLAVVALCLVAGAWAALDIAAHGAGLVNVGVLGACALAVMALVVFMHT